MHIIDILYFCGNRRNIEMSCWWAQRASQSFHDTWRQCPLTIIMAMIDLICKLYTYTNCVYYSPCVSLHSFPSRQFIFASNVTIKKAYYFRPCQIRSVFVGYSSRKERSRTLESPRSMAKSIRQSSYHYCIVSSLGKDALPTWTFGLSASWSLSLVSHSSTMMVELPNTLWVPAPLNVRNLQP